MAWTTVVSQKQWKAYQRGGRWIAPQTYAACKAKERAQSQNQRWGAGAGWSAYGNRPQRTSPTAPPPAPKSLPKARAYPKTPDGKMEGRGGNAAAASSPAVSTAVTEALSAAFADILAKLGSEGMEQQHLIRFGELLSSSIPTTATSPMQQLETERLWASRVKSAHDKLHEWHGKRDKLREIERKAKRNLESADRHIQYWEERLNAANRKAPNWELIKFTDINYDLDSDAGQDSDSTKDLDEVMSAADDLKEPADVGPNAPNTSAPPTAAAPAPAFSLPMAGTPFRNLDGSAFMTEGGNPAPVPDVMALANAQKAQMKEQGARHGIPDDVLESAIKEGHPLALIVSSWYQAKTAAQLYSFTKEEQDLSHSPLAARMANHLVQGGTNNTASEAPVTQLKAAAIEAAGDVP